MPYMSKKDIDDILFGIEQDVDFIAASFVRTADDIREIKTLLRDNGGRDIRMKMPRVLIILMILFVKLTV